MSGVKKNKPKIGALYVRRTFSLRAFQLKQETSVFAPPRLLLIPVEVPLDLGSCVLLLQKMDRTNIFPGTRNGVAYKVYSLSHRNILYVDVYISAKTVGPIEYAAAEHAWFFSFSELKDQ